MSIKRATTIEEQLQKLRDRGMDINNESKACENLLDIGYFRLGFYCFPFEVTFPNKEHRNHQYIKGTCFDDIVKLYYFDVDLRKLLSQYIYRIEINFRTYLIYTASNRYKESPTWFTNPTYVSRAYVSDFDKQVYNDSFRKIQIIKQHHKYHINDRYAPAWKTLEFMTFGSILKLFSSLKEEDLKLEIAKHYGFRSLASFESYMETIRIIRNACAHSNVLLDINLPQSIRTGPAGKLGQDKNRLAGSIKVIGYMLSCVSENRAMEMEQKMIRVLTNNSVPQSVKEAIEKCSGLRCVQK